jgi:hypothetical protein
MLAERLQSEVDSNARSKTTSMVGGGRRFESVRGLCKIPAKRGFFFRVGLQDPQRAVGMEPFMEPSGRVRLCLKVRMRGPVSSTRG